jgi:hypothetical protein
LLNPAGQNDARKPEKPQSNDSVKIVFESPTDQKKGFIKKFWILKNRSKISIPEGTMIVKKMGDAADFKPQSLGIIEPG